MTTPMNERKRGQLSPTRLRKVFAVKPLAIGVAAVLLSGCGEEPEVADIYRTVSECADNNPGFFTQCEYAYESAVEDAIRTAPRFSNERDCEFEFGDSRCEYVTNENGSFFMPFMAGFMLSRMLFQDDDWDIDLKKKKKKRYYSQPLFTSYSRRSSLRNQWFDASGKSFGGTHRSAAKVYGSDFKAKPTASRTLSRGGFGKAVASRSSSRSFGG
jgi:uncharacterized protein YgiB involved in biofilm formation